MPYPLARATSRGAFGDGALLGAFTVTARTSAHVAFYRTNAP